MRWQALQEQAACDYAPPRYEPPYTMAELDYVNKRWGTEFRFLTQYRLKIHEEKDRSEGRRIIRALIKGRHPADKEEKNVYVEGKLGDYLLPNFGQLPRRTRDSSAPRVPFL